MPDTYAQSGSSTSRETAEHRRRFKDDVLLWVSRRGVAGATWSEVAARFGVHHGEASAVLSRLHKDGQVARLTQRQGRNHIYVHPEFVDGRAIEPYGGRPRVVADTLALQRQVDNLLARLDDMREERGRLLRQLATPPEGWFTFGTHVDKPRTDLEFWGQDESHLPLWERPKPKTTMPIRFIVGGQMYETEAVVYPKPTERLVGIPEGEVEDLLRGDLDVLREKFDAYVADMDDKVEKVAAWLPYLDMGSALDRQVAHNIRTILELPEGS